MGENDQPTGGNPGAAEDLEKASLDTVYEKLATSAKGLASAEAKQRLEKYGRNELVEKEASDLEEAVVAIRDASGKVRMHHATHFTGPVALGGGFMGMMAGLMLLNPFLALIGGIAGTALGAITGALKELGIDEAFMKKMASHLKPGSSALFILAKEGRPEEIYKEIKKFNGQILQTRLAHQDETKLAAALAAANK